MEETPPQPEETTDAITVDEYYGWAASFENLPPEIRFIVLSKSGGRIVNGGSNLLQQAHRHLLESARKDCDPDVLAHKIREANLSVYERNKPVYVVGFIAVLICLCVGVYKFSKVVSSVIA